MAISFVQWGDSTTQIASGVAATVLPANATSGNDIVLLVLVATNTDSVSTITGGGMSSWSQVGTAISVTSAENMSMWWGHAGSGGSQTVTVTTTSGSGYYAQATEFFGVSATAPSSIQSGNNLSANPSLGISVNTNQLCVAFECSQNPVTAFTGLTSDYNGSSAWKWADGVDNAYQIAGSTGTLTPTWTMTSGNWGIKGGVWTPAGAPVVPASYLVSQPVLRRRRAW